MPFNIRPKFWLKKKLKPLIAGREYALITFPGSDEQYARVEDDLLMCLRTREMFSENVARMRSLMS